MHQHQAAQVQRQHKGHGMEKAGGRRGFGWDRAPVVPSCPVHVPLTKGQPQVRRPPRRKERGGSNEGYRPQQSGGGVKSVYASVYGLVWRQHTMSSTPIPCSHTQGQQDQTSLWPLIYLYARSTLCSERETRETHLSKY